MVRYLIFSLMSFCLVKIHYLGAAQENNRYIPSEYIVIADQISHKVGTTLLERYKNYDIKIIGVTSGMADCVRLIGFDFQIRGPLSKDEIRKMIVNSVEEFLMIINDDGKIRPYLAQYPFKENGIHIGVFLKDTNSRDIYYPNISVAYTSQGKIYYRTVSKDNTYGYKTKEDEDYSTAKKIVQESNTERKSNDRM